MTKRDFIILGCRILALWSVATFANDLALIVVTEASKIVSVFQRGYIIFGYTFIVGFFTCFGDVIMVAISVWLWLKADSIAKRLAPQEEEDKLTIDVPFVTSVLALAGIVLFIFGVKGFTGALMEIVLLWKSLMGATVMQTTLTALTAIFQIAVGCWFFWGGHKLAPFFERIQKGVE